MSCLVYQPGLISYAEALNLQRRLSQLRLEGKISDILFVLEHPPTITLGKFGRMYNILLSPSELAKKGIAFCATGRGGDVTYHCPGQLVAYPIIDLRARGRDIHRYLYDLEEVANRTLARFDIAAERWSDHAGVWVGGKQIAAIGLQVSRWITMHGLALNVNPDLEPFELINICGLPGKQATSMAQQLGHDVPMVDAIRQMLDSFSIVFETELEFMSSLAKIGETIE